MRCFVLALALCILLIPGSGVAGTVAGVERQKFERISFGWAHKLGTGVMNVAFSPVEILFNATNHTHMAILDDENVAAALFAGTITGVGFTVLRATSGVVQIATFPVPYPREPLMTPDIFHLAFGTD